MKLDLKWLLKNILLSLLLFGVFLYLSTVIIMLASDLFLFITYNTVGYTYLIFLVILVFRVIFEQRKDYKQDPKHLREITVHFTVLNVITYLLIEVILYFALRNGPIDMYTRFGERVIIYDFIYLNITNSILIASVLDYITVVVLMTGSSFICYKYLSKGKKLT